VGAAPQSAGHEAAVSPNSQAPLPQTAQDPQSEEQEEQVSEPLQDESPQVGAEPQTQLVSVADPAQTGGMDVSQQVEQASIIIPPTSFHIEQSSLALRQGHAEQGPPQSTPVSPWFWMPSEQVAVGPPPPREQVGSVS
jgi:hypothetical protein